MAITNYNYILKNQVFSEIGHFTDPNKFKIFGIVTLQC
jgi:hypothetical protein